MVLPLLLPISQGVLFSDSVSWLQDSQVVCSGEAPQEQNLSLDLLLPSADAY